ncbi:fungal-specific transcription factor domain-containing protein [Neofusicoccum parvum]|nr:fungal-specific transcription factor domain-containing protein [Neofusicoccum parvum]
MQLSPIQHDRPLDEFNRLLGFTGEPISICARISEIPSIRDATALATEVQQIILALDRCEPHRAVARHTFPSGTDPRAVFALENTAAVYRSAAFLYLHSVLRRMGVRGSVAPRLHAALVAAVPVEKAGALARCVALVERCGVEQPRSELNALIFPLFLIGCERETGAQEALVLRVLTRMERNSGFGNVSEAKRILRHVWDCSPVGSEDAERLHWLDIVAEFDGEVAIM